MYCELCGKAIVTDGTIVRICSECKDKDKLSRGAYCEHEGNPECECKEKFCPLKTIKKK